MPDKRLRLYHLNPDYVGALARVDRRVMSTAPAKGKDKRPFVGIVIPHGDSLYCIPLSSPKPKHHAMKADRDFSKIVDRRGKLIAVLNFNNMIPVDGSVLSVVDLGLRPGDLPKERAYKELMRDQLRWCNEHREAICSKAAKLYRIVTERPESARGLVRRCCDYQSLERELTVWLESHAS